MGKRIEGNGVGEINTSKMLLGEKKTWARDGFVRPRFKEVKNVFEHIVFVRKERKKRIRNE